MPVHSASTFDVDILTFWLMLVNSGWKYLPAAAGKQKTRISPSSALKVVAKAGIEPATHGFSEREERRFIWVL